MSPLSPASEAVAIKRQAAAAKDSGLGVHHLWVGAVLGVAAMGAYFAWRNPGLLHPV